VKLDSQKVIFWYSLVSGVSASALLFAYVGVLVSLLGLGIVALATYLILISVHRYEESNSPFGKLSEQIASVGLILFIPLILISNLFIALLVFIVFVYLALLFQTHDYRRFYIGLMVGFTALIAGAVETKSGFYLVYFLAYTVTISMALGYAHIEPMSGNRACWRVGDRVRASIWLIVSAVIIYLILPRFPAGNLGARPGSDHYYENAQWEREAKNTRDGYPQGDPVASLLDALTDSRDSEQNTAAETDPSKNDDHPQSGFHYRGFEREMDINNPDAKGERFSNVIVARMRADRPLYLRARIFDRFDGVRWSSSAEQLEKLKLNHGQLRLRDSAQHEREIIEHYEIFIEQDLGDYVAAAAVPTKINFPGSVIAIDAFGQLHAPGTLREGSGYAVDSLRKVIQGRSFAELEAVDLPEFVQLPADMDPRITVLANQLAQGHETEFEVAIAFEHHLRTAYAYDFSSVFDSQDRTPLSQFLFETKRGHCEYFASALAILLRTQGIPSRLVTGFSATNLNPLTGYYDIYALDGHAWVEAYVDGLGWMELEPTAYYDGPSTDNQTLSAEQINDYVERQTRRQQVIGEEGLSPEVIFSSLWQTGYLGVVWFGAYLKLLFMKSWHWLLGAGGVLLAGWIVWPQLRPRWRVYRIHKDLETLLKRRPESAIDHYLEAVDALLHNAGYRRPPGLSIEDYLSKLEAFGIIIDESGMSKRFNRRHYGAQGRRSGATEYQQLFETLHAMGYKALRQRIANSISPRGI
jgi:transglutaminase-like putative cysteine protease